jgi:hypothetical protein
VGHDEGAGGLVGVGLLAGHAGREPVGGHVVAAADRLGGSGREAFDAFGDAPGAVARPEGVFVEFDAGTPQHRADAAFPDGKAFMPGAGGGVVGELQCCCHVKIL